MDETMVIRAFGRQHGLVTRAQVVAAAGTDGEIRQRLEKERWVRAAPSVYRLAGVPVTWKQRALAACLAAGPGAVVSHRSAAVVHGVSGFRPGRLDVTVPPGRSARNALATVHRSVLAPGDRAVRDRIPVTTPARTVCDLACDVGPELLEEAVDDVLCRRLVSLEKLLARPGPRVLGKILEAWNADGEPANVAEMRLVRALLTAGLPQTVRQFEIKAAAARVDLAYPEARLAIELDSFRWHAGRRPFGSDRARGNRIEAAGWHLLRAVPAQDTAPLISAAGHLLRRVA